jgi:tetratricopeptide (TPR) repeat protein
MKRKTVINVTRVVLIATLSFLLFTNYALAEMKTFIKEYTYQASDEDSKNSSRTVALREIKRLLLEELGTYLESETEVQNFQLTKDQITTLTAGIVQTELIEEKWNTENLKYWLKARITADSGEVIKSIDSLRKDRQKTKELEEIRKRSDELLKENERLRKVLATTGTKHEQEKAAHSRNVKELNAIEWLEKGIASYNLGNYNIAIDALSNSIKLHPKPNPFAYQLRGVYYSKLGNSTEAINDFNKSIELNPQNVATYNSLGLEYLKLDEFNESIQKFNKAIMLKPKDEMSFINRGIAYEKLSNYNQAIKDFDKAIKINKYSYIAYLDRGVVYGKLGKHIKALQDFSKAIQINQSYGDAYYNRALMHSNLNNYKQAIKDYDKTIELNPQHAAFYVRRGLLYGKLDNLDNSINDFKIAARLGDKWAQDFLETHGIPW